MYWSTTNLRVPGGGVNHVYQRCGSAPGVMMADTLSFNAKIGVVDF